MGEGLSGGRENTIAFAYDRPGYGKSDPVWVDSGHGIPLEKPEAIISAIHEVLAQ